METQIKESLISLLTAIKAADGQVVADSMARLDESLARDLWNRSEAWVNA